jgi:TolC family type I secretion outer membrane protein
VKKTLALLLLLLAFPSFAWAAPADPQAALTLEHCLQMAFDHHPDIVSSAWQVRRSGSQVEVAKSSMRPTLDLGASVTDSEGAQARSASDLSVKQLLTDSGKTRAAIAGASHDLSATRKEAERTWQERAYAVKEAYFNLLRAREDQSVAAETVALYEAQLRQAEAFYRAGSSSKIDVTTAEVNLSQARLDLAKARSSASTAVAVLENEIGTRLPDRQAALETPREAPLPVPGLEEAQSEALAARPDVLAGGERVLSAREALAATAKGLSPSLYASGGYGFSDSSSGWEDEWTAGVSLSIPLYDGGATAARTEAARAELEISRSDLEKLSNTVRLEVSTALLDLETASAQVKTAETALRQAEENLRLAQGRYRVGVGTSLEVTDASEKYSTARKTLVQARYDLQVAGAALVKALGRPVEIRKEDAK